MTTHVPREAYSQDELSRLYPKGLQLQLVQVLLRHGERSPVSTRFQNTGLPQYWPYCSAAKRISSVVMTGTDFGSWDDLEWRRRLETFGKDDEPVVAAGPKGENDGVCQLGELTDQGRATTYALGQRLRRLYVDQLGFMPKVIGDADMIYLRATPMSRALESLQQSFWGMYPKAARTATFPPPTIVTRTPADETLFPNDSNCRRFGELSRAFAQRTADRWNDSPDMDYLNKLISKWMPEGSRRVAVDSRPRLSGIMDTINSTLAHPAPTRLPAEFYDAKGREIIERIGVEEWFSGYGESREYRAVGIGGLVGDLVSRMVANVEHNTKDGIEEIGDRGETGDIRMGRGGERNIRFAMSGCHDTTLAAVLASLGAFEGEKWPPYTSHIALELFKGDGVRKNKAEMVEGSLWGRLFGARKGNGTRSEASTLESIARKQTPKLSAEEKGRLDGYFVRMRYNDRVMKVPGCKVPGNHLEGDDSFCTLEAFKSIADKFTPNNWQLACVSNTDAPAFPKKPEPAGV